MSEDIKGAKEAFAAGFNCAEAVAISVCRELDVGDGIVPQAATGFGGGGGGAGGTCGALSGAFLALSLKYGRTSTDEDRRWTYAVCQPIYDGFVKEMGTAACRELTGLDLRTPEGGRQLRESGIHQRVCVRAVEVAERLALEQFRLRESAGG
ncbi:MAG: C-GCAxxG-C-C family protein [Dehalococcoidia bacterium]